MRAPLDDPIMAGFVSQLEHINSVADESAGFIWRLQTEEGDATSIRVFEDALILFNMSVWESIESLRDYVYRGPHGEPFRQRKLWFQRLDGPNQVLWWIARGQIPTVEEAKRRFEKLQSLGPTADGRRA